jgi:hypothetical protein
VTICRRDKAEDAPSTQQRGRRRYLTTLLPELRVSGTGEFIGDHRTCVAFRGMPTLPTCVAFRGRPNARTGEPLYIQHTSFRRRNCTLGVKQMCRTNGKPSGTHAMGDIDATRSACPIFAPQPTHNAPLIARGQPSQHQNSCLYRTRRIVDHARAVLSHACNDIRR